MSPLTEPKTGSPAATTSDAPEPPAGRQWPITSLLALIGFVFVPTVMTVTGVSVGGDDPPVDPGGEGPAVVASAGDGLAFATSEPEPEPASSPLGDLNAWVEDRVPGKELAFEFERTTTRIIDDNYTGAVADNPRVLLGDDGWLFITDATDIQCVTPEREAQWQTELDRVSTQLTEAGKRAVFAIAPDRSLIVPERMADIPNECQGANAMVVDRLAERPDVLDLGTVVNDEAHALQLDTHWSPEGAATGMREVVNAIEPGLWGDGVVLEPDVEDRPGDLDGLVGYANTETVNVVSVPQDNPTELVQQQTSIPGRPLVQATTAGAHPLNVLLIHDSFGGYFAAADPTRYQTGAGAHYLRPWFESVDNVRLAGDNAASITDPAVAAAIDDADVVVFLFVQRRLDFRFGPGLLSDPLASALGQ